MACRIFVSFARGDDAWAVQLSDSISRLENIEAYIPEWVTFKGKDMVYKVKEGLNNSQVVVVLITFNSTNTVWLNQQIGYAFAKSIPMILVVEKGIDVKGFLEGRDYITYQRGNFKQNVWQIISKLRTMLPQHVPGLSIERFSVTCKYCNKKFLEQLPTQDVLLQKINSGITLDCHCPFCSLEIHVEPSTLSSMT